MTMKSGSEQHHEQRRDEFVECDLGNAPERSSRRAARRPEQHTSWLKK